jgi:hypothetical protein
MTCGNRFSYEEMTPLSGQSHRTIESEGSMKQTHLSRPSHPWLQHRTTYRGFIITPIAAYDGGLYAAMFIIGDPNGLQRASGVLGQFASAEEACAFALVIGKEEVDRRFSGTPAAA